MEGGRGGRGGEGRGGEGRGGEGRGGEGRGGRIKVWNAGERLNRRMVHVDANQDVRVVGEGGEGRGGEGRGGEGRGGERRGGRIEVWNVGERLTSSDGFVGSAEVSLEGGIQSVVHLRLCHHDDTVGGASCTGNVGKSSLVDREREGGREGGRERGREGGREGERVLNITS